MTLESMSVRVDNCIYIYIHTNILYVHANFHVCICIYIYTDVYAYRNHRATRVLGGVSRRVSERLGRTPRWDLRLLTPGGGILDWAALCVAASRVTIHSSYCTVIFGRLTVVLVIIPLDLQDCGAQREHVGDSS